MAIYKFNELNSTNLHLKQNFNKYENFDVISAEHQTNGYGRFKRSWLDLGGDNIFMSICLKFDEFNQNISAITQYSALVLAKTFDNYGLKTQIKWPNDLHVNGKKISGILAESVISNSKFEGIVLGIGININTKIENFSSVNQKVTSLNYETSMTFNKYDFIESFMKYFEEGYSQILSGGFKSFKEEYKHYLNFLGKEIQVSTSKSTKIYGIAKDVTDDGLLILETDNKTLEISAGDINY